MKIGIIDADLVGRDKHRFPNLASEKISAYHKELGDDAGLITRDEDIGTYDRIFISKAFTDTPLPDWVSRLVRGDGRVSIGGTGFYFDKAPPLEDAIEHHMPDYHLYDDWVRDMKAAGGKATTQFKYYEDYSIGFLTRGCFRKCQFCVNHNYDRVVPHSSLDEFYDPSRKKICLLDDNFWGCAGWKTMMREVMDTGRKFVFKQGLDVRLMTDEKAEMLFSSNYDGHYIFAFDNIDDYDLIENKLKIIRRHTGIEYIKFYVLVGFNGTDEKDVVDCFRRIELLMRYHCLPYIMRYQSPSGRPIDSSRWKDLYGSIAAWCNQPFLFTKMSFRKFCEASQDRMRTNMLGCILRSMREFESEHPEIAKRFFGLKYDDFDGGKAVIL